MQTNALLNVDKKRPMSAFEVSQVRCLRFLVKLKKGRLFNDISVTLIPVIDDNTAKLFLATENPLGKTIIIGKVVIEVIRM